MAWAWTALAVSIAFGVAGTLLLDKRRPLRQSPATRAANGTDVSGEKHPCTVRRPPSLSTLRARKGTGH